MMIQFRKGPEIYEDELIFKTSRSGGPGGQNVNKLSTRVEVFFDVPGSKSFSDEQKKQILKKLAARASKEGVIRVASQRYRSQRANRQAAIEGMRELLKKAMETQPSRKKTTVPYHAMQQRLEEKKQRSAVKQQRGKKIPPDYN